MPIEIYALPAVEDTDPTGETFHRPKYVDDTRVDGYNSALIPAPGGFPGTTTPGGQIFVAAVDATQAAHDDAAAQSDVWSIGNDSGDDVTPEEAADYLNDHFRVDLSGIDDPDVVAAFETLLDQLGPEYRRLSASEWFERLGLNGTN